ncbi:MAG: RNA methyltransferase [Oscillospiraceae bacterium]|nr:RNA methyltransferase [Oscillospiraceae bacterium]
MDDREWISVIYPRISVSEFPPFGFESRCLILPKQISSRENDKIKLYRRLASDKKYRRRENMFVLEGIRLITDAVSAGTELYCVFACESAAEKYADFFSLISGSIDDERLFLIPDSLAKFLSDTDKPQGFFAISRCKTLDKSFAYDKIKSGGRYLLLCDIQDPGNMGTMLRTAEACGIDAVFLSDCCDIYSPKTVRSTMGSLFRMDIAIAEISETVSALKNSGITVYAAVVDEKAKSLTDCDFSAGGAVMIGNEGNGLPSDIAALADVPMTIRMSGRVNSLNAAMAAGIIMWEMRK